ncbi:MurR/RpiR family transcriptional regulator [Microvirga puerhi]|uniref:MurR/RpiR family transcriptional regulator n=1 Tax=Microvirga puerhi TaxID=2876078 RepID=A0ABS7VSY8_9HYPH|nr:MurR/RpiR family transcriptional regulator [Microvirga puerhi]MBZ6078678.1 MurR/RpiR family transcriptional regulator [Microvirga puerhi]
MGLIELIERHDEALTDSDRRLVAVLLEARDAGGLLPAREVAQRAGVHEATAGRLARKLGFDSYRDLRESLQNAMISNLDSSARMRKRLGRVAGRSILQSIVDGEIETLSALPHQIPQADLDRAVEALRTAGRIIIGGESHASSLAELFARRLVRSGYRASSLAHFDWKAADELLGLKAKDAVIIIAFRYVGDSLKSLVRHAQSLSATTILITDLRPPPFKIDICLSALRGHTGETQSLTVPMAICNALVLGLSLSDGGRSLETLAELENVRRGLGVHIRRAGRK